MMKRSVRKPPVIDEVVKTATRAGAIVAVVVLLISALIDASATVLQLLLFVGVAVGVLVEVKPPWLLGSPLGRWLRR